MVVLFWLDDRSSFSLPRVDGNVSTRSFALTTRALSNILRFRQHGRGNYATAARTKSLEALLDKSSAGTDDWAASQHAQNENNSCRRWVTLSRTGAPIRDCRRQRNPIYRSRRSLCLGRIVNGLVRAFYFAT
jgi:hypothetical protein